MSIVADDHVSAINSGLPTPYYEQDGITIYNCTWQEALPLIAPIDVGVVLTDPPYGTGGWRRPDAGAGSNPTASLVREDWDDGDIAWVGSVPGEAILTFWPPAKTSDLLNAAISRGFTKHRQLYWRKPDPKPQPGGRTRWSMEPVWVLSQDGFQLFGNSDDMYEFSALRSGNPESTGHPYQKPLKVMRWLLSKIKTEGAVLDPFMGSGSTLRAAKDMGMRAIGVEMNEAYCEIAANRLAQSVLPLEVS